MISETYEEGENGKKYVIRKLQNPDGSYRTLRKKVSEKEFKHKSGTFEETENGKYFVRKIKNTDGSYRTVRKKISNEEFYSKTLHFNQEKENVQQPASMLGSLKTSLVQSSFSFEYCVGSAIGFAVCYFVYKFIYKKYK